MYHAFLRVSEVAKCPNSKHTLLLKSFKVKKNHLLIKMYSYKHSKNETKRLKIKASGDELCPLKAFKSFGKVRGKAPGPAFIKENGLPIKRNDVSNILKKALSASLRYLSSPLLFSFREESFLLLVILSP